MDKDEALKLAKAWFERNTYADEAVEVYEAIEQALAAPTVQEPVAAESKFNEEKEWNICTIEHHKLVQSEPHRWPGYQTRLLYTTPPAAQRQWVGLEEKEIDKLKHLIDWTATWSHGRFAYEIEQLLKEKNA